MLKLNKRLPTPSADHDTGKLLGETPATLRETDEHGNIIVEVDVGLCRAIAERISQNPVPEDREDVEVRDIPSNLIGNFFLFIVAICHQTSPIGRRRLQGVVEGRVRAGWDYLIGRFHERALAEPSLLEPRVWASMTEARLTSLFADSQFGNSLSEVSHRADLVRDLGGRMLAHGWTHANQFFEACAGRIASGEPNLLGIMESFHAYRDPVRKKSLFFLSLMRNAGQWDYVDAQALGPPVDYHEVRGHLRIGTVRIIDPQLRGRIASGIEVSESQDIAIRRAVYNVIVFVSELTGIRNSSRMHYLFWNVFRGVCTREQPRCASSERPPHLPERYLAQLDIDTLYHCPFEKNCQSAHVPSPVTEHVFTTDFY